eukprot:TRINITY_DN48332_c0_g1_i1.p1 TRINITY_DN48332_c0_g1~~TRINITY_DN48332_c0_g1_i1.p1  ORF type:complete len:443 (+),score=112.34 TRINITY_DN48332_c0_g1_i1:198-1331(+)
MHDLFDNKITPLVDKVNAMALEDIAQLKQDVEQVVADTTQEIDNLIVNAAETAQKLIDRSIEEIKESIIDETAAKVEEATDNFFKGLGGFLQKFYETIQKVDCMVKGDIDKIKEDVYELIGEGCRGLFPDKCCGQEGVKGKALAEMGDTQVYGLEICRRSDGLTPKSPVADIKKAYVDCQIAAKKFYCIDFGAGAAKDFFTKEYNKWGIEYAFWFHPNYRGGGKLSADEPLDECGSPVECYHQAIQMLNEARQEIKDKADKVDLEGKADKVDLASKANKTELATKVDKTEFSDLKNQTSKNSDDVSKNSDALSSLQSKVNGLSISLCDCYDEASERDVQDCHYTGTCARLGCSRDGYVMVDQLLRQEQIHATVVIPI